MSAADFAAIEVGGVFLDAWQEYSFASDLFTPADGFSLKLNVGTSRSSELRETLGKLRALIFAGATVKFWIGAGELRALQGTGVIDSRSIECDADGGTSFAVEGRDFGAYLVDSAAPTDLYEADDTFVSIARRAVAPWGLDVKAEHTLGRDLRQARVTKDRLRRLQNKAKSLGIPSSKMSEKIAASIDKGTIDFDEFSVATLSDVNAQRAARLGIPYSGGDGLSSLAIYQLRVKDVKPQAGETVWEFLERHAKRNGFLMRMDPDGALVVCGLEYNQAPSGRLIRKIQDGRQNNIISGGERYDASNMYRRVVVYGRAKGGDAARSLFKGEAIDGAPDAIAYEKTLILTDSSIKTQAAAQARAQYELGKSRQGAQVLHYVVRSHVNAGLIYATDTVLDVDDDIAGVHGPFYVVSRTFQRSVANGSSTDLKLVPLGSIALKEPGS